jgi:glycosyltransferase involved in cell wall biosynthesis
MDASRSVSLVVPMYNEEESVGHFLEVALPALARHAGDWEIVFVDDGSADRSAALIESRAAAEPRIRLVRHERNRGLGGALRSGFAAASKEWILYSDCDLPWDLEEMGRLFRAAEVTGCDVVAAFRHDRTQEGLLRLVYSFVYNGLVHVLFGVGLRDVNFACKLFRRRLLDGVSLRSEGSFIDVELLARLVARGAVVQQLGLDYFPRTRGTSTLSSPKTILRLLREMGSLAGDLRRDRRPAAS